MTAVPELLEPAFLDRRHCDGIDAKDTFNIL